VLPPEIAADAVGGGGVVRMKCNAVSAAATAEWCEGSCSPTSCPEALCECKVDEGAKDAAREAWMSAKLAATRGTTSLKQMQREARERYGEKQAAHKVEAQLRRTTKVAMPPSKMPEKAAAKATAETRPEAGPAKVHLVKELDGSIHSQ